MIRDPELDKLLEAHRLNGGISALQLPAGFVRNATFDKSSR
jgi:sigma-E factor negative regulatory protein RseA